MSYSEFSFDSNHTWEPLSACKKTVNDGINLREIILDNLDRDTKRAILEFLKAYKLSVSGVDTDTYTVDLSKWDRNKSEQFIEILKAMGGKLPKVVDEKLDEASGNEEAESVISPDPSIDAMEVEKITFKEVKPKVETNVSRAERMFPIQPHREEELDFGYLTASRQFPVQTNPIYQKDELLNLKPMLMKEDTQSTMGSANIEVRKVKKSRISFRSIFHCIAYPFYQIKRLKLSRFFRKHFFKRKSKEEKIRKEKAFAVYTSLLEEGPRLGREFRASLKSHVDKLRTTATNTWPICDDWSTDTEVLRVNRGVNAVAQVMEAAVNTVLIYRKEESCFREIPKVFSDPEEEPIIWCPCQFISSSFLYKCFSKCLNYFCDWENGDTDLLKDDIANQKEELREVKSMLVGALDLLEKAKATNGK